MSSNDEKPVCPQEATPCISADKNDETSISDEFDTCSIAVRIKTEKDTDDIGGGELDYEEEFIQPSSDDKKDESIPPSDDKNDESIQITSDDKNDESKEIEEGEDVQPSSDDKKDDGREIEEGEDEGEISGEEDDLEEGELKDGPSGETSQSIARQVCRFFTRGQCYYGNACRFLHLTNGKGQYNMFARYSEGYGAIQHPIITDRLGPRTGMDYMGPLPIPPPAPVEQSYVESAWERGLREAKELVKKANKRKEEEPDFDKKKNYLSINFNEKNTDFDKENEYLKSPFSTKRNPDTSFEYDDHRVEHRGGRGGYENFEIHYDTRNTRDEIPQRTSFDRRTGDRSRGRMSVEQERQPYASKDRNRDRNKLKDERTLLRTRAFEYVDPWRRSKTPKARGGRSRSGSYSSVSSSYSERTSRSASGSYSRSSSRSSAASSRSPSVHKEKSSAPDAGFSKGGSNRAPVVRKKPTTTRSPSYSSRSRSVSRSPSLSRSRSYSRSISMDSVSSDSSCVSHSSRDTLRNQKIGQSALMRKKAEEKLPLEMLDVYRAQGTSDPTIHDIYQEPADNSTSAFPSFRHLIPGDDKVKTQQKQPIKLTLLQKPTTSKASFPRKDTDRSKLMDTKSDSKVFDAPTILGKRPLSPTLSALQHMKQDSLLPKKSASSRRDELLKQLKAVEDAIARKRAKF